MPAKPEDTAAASDAAKADAATAQVASVAAGDKPQTTETLKAAAVADQAVTAKSPESSEEKVTVVAKRQILHSGILYAKDAHITDIKASLATALESEDVEPVKDEPAE